MNILFLVILLFGISAIIVSGTLLDNFSINSGGLGVLDDPSELTITECTCEDPENPGNFSSEFCDPAVFEEGALCASLQQPLGLEIPVMESQIFGEGCDATFWKELQNPEIIHTTFWPPEYNPDFHFNDVFLTNLDNSYFLTTYGDSGNSIHQLKRGDLTDRLELLKTQYSDDIPTTTKIDSAITSIQNSLNPSLWINDLHLDPNGGKQIFEEDKNVVLKLTLVIETQEIIIQNSSEENKPTEEEKLEALQEIVRDIVDSERVLVVNANEDAEVYVKDLNKLEQAILEFNNAEEKFQGKEYAEAVDSYKNSWIHSQQALNLHKKNSYGPTLLEVLNEKPNHHAYSIGLEDLARQSMAALLNAAHNDVPYYYQSQEVLDMTQLTVLEGDIDAIEEFGGLNNLHSVLCP
ncbi:MAG: hypothetical protein OEQ12_04355 [Nitrosopumilus sp.]|nr:hypothetical protein [Nitrosopumilus sp.]